MRHSKPANRRESLPASEGTELGAGRAAEVLLGLAKTLASTLDIDEVLDRVLDSLSLVVPHDSASLALLDGEALEIRAVRGFSKKEEHLGRRLALHDLPLSQFIVESGIPLVIDDIREDPRWTTIDPSPKAALIRSWMGVPLVASGSNIGMLSVDGNEIAAFGEGTLALTRAFADLAAVAVRNARLFSETKRRVKELDAVNRVTTALASRLDVESLCVLVGKKLLEIFGTGVVFVALYDEGSSLISTPFFAISGRRERFDPIPLGVGLTSRVISSKKPLYIDSDMDGWSARLGAIQRSRRQVKSWLGVPILSGEGVLGVLSVQSFDKERAFVDEDIRLLSTIAASVGAGIQNARLYQEARRKAEEAAALAEAGREISESLDPDVVLQRIAERARALLTDDCAAVYLLESDGSLKPVVAVGPAGPEVLRFQVPKGAGIVGRVAATGMAEIVIDTSSDSSSIHIPGTASEPSKERLMAAPLLVDDKVIGVMSIWRKPDEAVPKKAELDTLVGLARQASVAIQNARLHRRATETASRVATLYEEASAARAEAEEANRHKSRFLANMSHELRTPLNSIINFAYLLLAGAEGVPSPGQAELLGRVEEAGKQLLGLINDVLDFSKIESGKLELSVEPLDLAEVARGVLATAAGLVADTGVELLDELPENLPPALADRTRLRQIFLNLLSNAAKFTRSGYIVLRARAEEGEIVAEVEDSGMGMRPEDIPRAFEEFVQIDDDLDRRAGGSGLGLPLVKRFVELHGGRIWARSEPGKGALFAFSIPRADRSRTASEKG